MVPQIQDILDAANRMFFVMMLLGLPTLITSLVVGVAISLVQTVTGVQEMTLTFVPKLVIVLVVMAFTLPWSIEVILQYTESLFQLFSTVADHESG